MNRLRLARASVVPLGLGIAAIVLGMPALAIVLVGTAWVAVFVLMAQEYRREVRRHGSH